MKKNNNNDKDIIDTINEEYFESDFSVKDSYLVKQSYKLTKLKYDILKPEKNIFLKIVELCQKYEKGESLDKGCSLEMIIGKMSGKESPEITFPIKELVTNTHRNYEIYSKALKRLASRPFHLPDEKWDFTQINLFERVQGSEGKSVFKIKMTETFWELFHAKGAFKMIDTAVAYKFKHVSSARMYDLLVGNKDVQSFKIDHLMSLLGKESYSSSDFVKNVIKVAEQELKTMPYCPFYFEYTLKKKGKKFDLISFDVISKNIDEDGFSIEPKNLDDKGDNTVIENEGLNIKIKNFAIQMYELEELSSTLESNLIEAQNKMGVDGLLKKLRDIFITMQGQTLTVSTGAYLNGALKIIIGEAEKKRERKNNAKKLAEEAVVFTENTKSENEEEIYTFEFLEGRAKLAGTTVDEIIKCMNLELEEDNKYRKKK